MFAHNKSGIAYQDKSRRPESVVHPNTQSHQQLRLPPNCTTSTILLQGIVCGGGGAAIKPVNKSGQHQVQACQGSRAGRGGGG
jgi:hypothetical protein